MYDSIIAYNNPSYKDGGNVYGDVVVYGDTSMSNMTFTNNKGRFGGALVAITGYGSLTVKDSRFDQNEDYQGGAIFSDPKSLYVYDSNFTSNNA